MIALDTNTLVRFLVGDDKRQAQLVFSRFKQAEQKGERFLIPLLVVLETLWVLGSVYDLARADILDAVEDLMHMPILEFEADDVVTDFVATGRESRIELSDLLIACSAQSGGSESMFTFDRKACRLPFFQLLK